MTHVKTFTMELKPFHTARELETLDEQVNSFLSENRVSRVVSVSDSTTTGEGGATIGIIRVLVWGD